MAKPSPKSSPWLIVNTPPTKTCLPPRRGLQRPSYMFCQVSVFSLRKCLSGLSLVCVFSLVYSCTYAFGMCGRWKRLQRLMCWNRCRQLAECTGMTPADCVDKESTGHIMLPRTDTCTHSLCDAISVQCPGFSLFLWNVFFSLHWLTRTNCPPPSSGRGPRSGLITPSFSMKGNGSASVPKSVVPARPVPQPHPNDEDTLVQMAEHIPAGTRTPMCARCNMVIRWGDKYRRT